MIESAISFICNIQDFLLFYVQNLWENKIGVNKDDENVYPLDFTFSKIIHILWFHLWKIFCKLLTCWWQWSGGGGAPGTCGLVRSVTTRQRQRGKGVKMKVLARSRHQQLSCYYCCSTSWLTFLVSHWRFFWLLSTILSGLHPSTTTTVIMIYVLKLSFKGNIFSVLLVVLLARMNHSAQWARTWHPNN